MNWVQELQDRFSAPLRALAAEIAHEFPGVRTHLSSYESPDSSRACIGVSCLIVSPPSDPDVVDLWIVLSQLTTTPRIETADVCWGHPSGYIEADGLPDPVALNVESLNGLAETLPALSSALKNALRRGHPPSHES